MRSQLQDISREKFDILIIGGGISGACILWEATLRGYKAILIEKKDFGHATSMATSKLIHGGLRYLAQYDFRVVRESLQERKYFLEQLSPFVFPLPFLFPIYKWTPHSKYLIEAGLWVYEVLSLGKNDIPDRSKHIPPFRWVSKEEALRIEPSLDPRALEGAFIYYDAQNKHPERVNIEFILSSIKRGAKAFNYVECVGFLLEEAPTEKKVQGIQAKDVLTGKEFPIYAKVVINATGPWADYVLALLHKEPVRKLVRSVGIHILTNRLTRGFAITFETRDSHHFFVLPWLKYTLLGTTDTPFEDHPDQLRIYKDMIEDFLKTVKEHYPVSIRWEDIRHSYIGIRPLVADTKVKTSSYKLSRKHEIINHYKEEKIRGLFSVLGGKYTTSRSLAEEVIHTLEKEKYFPPTKSISKSTPLDATPKGMSLREFVEDAKARYSPQIPEKVLEHLIEYYGARYEDVLEYVFSDSSLLEPLWEETGTILAEIPYAIEKEMCLNISDFLLRRSGMGNVGVPPDKVLKKVAKKIAKYLSLKRKEVDEQIKEYLSSQKIW